MLVRPSLRRAIPESVPASTAYLLAMALDRRLTGNRYDDVVLWGDLLSRDPRRQRLVGIAVHFSVGVAVAMAYQMLRPVLPRLPGWLLGLLFLQLENAVTFPTVIWADTNHPASRSGKLPRLWSGEYFAASAARHAAYGLVLGMVSKREGRG
jgi:hypothetical protein